MGINILYSILLLTLTITEVLRVNYPGYLHQVINNNATENNIIELYRYSFFLLYFILFLSSFVNSKLIPIIIGLIIIYDDKFYFHALEGKSDTVPFYSMHFFFFSIFVTPILAKKFLLADFNSIILTFLVGIFIFVLSNMSILSSYTTIVPQAIFICAFVTKFIHLNFTKKHKFLFFEVKNTTLFTTFLIFLFLLCSLFLSDFLSDLIDKLCVREDDVEKAYKFLTGGTYDDVQRGSLKQYNFFDKLADFIKAENECNFLIIGYILISMGIFYKKSPQVEEKCFVCAAILSLLVKSFGEEANFFIFKSYLLMGLALLLDRISAERSLIFFLIILILVTKFNPSPSFFSLISNLLLPEE